MKSRFPLSIYVFLFLLPSAAKAEADPCSNKVYAADKALCVTISPYRVEQPIDRVGSAVTVITRQEMERRGDVSVGKALARVPGVHLSRNGGFGGASAIRVRGSEDGQVRVLIDGISVNDASSVNNAYDFSMMLATDIERIEVLRGAQSSLYGSDAMGGVINIITRKGGGGGGVTGFAETGAYQTYHQGLGYDGGTPGLYYGGSVQRFQTDGFSRVAAGSEEDGTVIHDYKAYVGGKPLDNFTLDFRGGYEDSDADFDPGTFTDGPADADRHMGYGLATATLNTLNDRLLHTVKLGANRTERRYDEPVGFFRFSTFDGTRLQGSYQADLDLRKRDVLTGGLEVQQDESESTNTSGGVITENPNQEAMNKAVFGQYLIGITDSWTATLGGRHDRHDQFGSFDTYRLTSIYNIEATGTAIRATHGTGFKAPTLYQLYAPTYGNASLQPEENKTYDIGIDQTFWNGRGAIGVTGFYNSYKNIIDFDFGINGYLNVVQANAKGVETTVSFAALPELLLSANYTYTLSENESTHRSLIRRPKHTGQLAADWDITPEARFGTMLNIRGHSWDNNFNGNEIKSYATLDVTGSYDINEHYTLYSRLENIFDREYQEVANFNAPGFAAYVGLRIKYR